MKTTTTLLFALLTMCAGYYLGISNTISASQYNEFDIRKMDEYAKAHPELVRGK